MWKLNSIFIHNQWIKKKSQENQKIFWNELKWRQRARHMYNSVVQCLPRMGSGCFSSPWLSKLAFKAQISCTYQIVHSRQDWNLPFAISFPSFPKLMVDVWFFLPSLVQLQKQSPQAVCETYKPSMNRGWFLQRNIQNASKKRKENEGWRKPFWGEV